MTLFTLIAQIILTIPLSILINYFNQKDNNHLNQIILPTIYIILIAALFPPIKTNIFLIVIFEFFIRNFYITNLLSEENKLSNKMFIIDNILSITLSLFTYNYFISQVKTLIPDPESMKSFIWFLIILYIISLYKTYIKNSSKVNQESQQKIKYQKEQIIMQYAKYKSNYSKIIKSKNENINNLIYAIIIYNNYKNPKFYRHLKEKLAQYTKKEAKYGIMQIESLEQLTDEESIKIVLKDFEKKAKKKDLKDEELITNLLNSYTKNEKENIISIYNIINDFAKK